MPGFELLAANLLSPIILAFVLGLVAGFIRSEVEVPEAVLKIIAVYLVFSIGLKGGAELRETNLGEIGPSLLITFAVVILIPVGTFLILRRIGGFDSNNAAAVAAHYGSVSSVTFFAALSFADRLQTPAEGFMPAIVALMEWSVIVALFLARVSKGRSAGADRRSLLMDTLRGHSILLLSGGLVIGMLTTERTWSLLAPFYDELFAGVLMLFLLEMGMTAARQMRAFREVGLFMTGFGILMPLVWGTMGVTMAAAIGLSLGGAFVFGAICGSASYIDAPAAVRASIPEANPGIYLTASLAITFPFNLLVGLPVYYTYATWLYG